MAEVKVTDVYGTIFEQKNAVKVFWKIMTIYDNKKIKKKWNQEHLEPRIVIIFYYMILIEIYI